MFPTLSVPCSILFIPQVTLSIRIFLYISFFTEAIRYNYLVVNDFNNIVNNNYIGASSNWILNNDILARIPLNEPYFTL